MRSITSGAKSELPNWFGEVFTGYEFQQVVEPIEKEIHEKGRRLLDLISMPDVREVGVNTIGLPIVKAMHKMLGMSDVRMVGVNTLEMIDPFGKFAIQCFEMESNPDTNRLYNCNITEELVYSDEWNNVPIEIWSNDYMDRKVVEKPEIFAGYQHVSKTDIIYRIRLKDESSRDYWLNLRTGEKKDITEFTKCDKDYSNVSIVNDKIVVYAYNEMFYIYDLDLSLIISGNAPRTKKSFQTEYFYNIDDIFYLILDGSLLGHHENSVFKIDLQKRTTEKILYNEGAFCVYNNVLYYSMKNEDSSGRTDSYTIMQLNFRNGNTRELEKIAYERSVGSDNVGFLCLEMS